MTEIEARFDSERVPKTHGRMKLWNVQAELWGPSGSGILRVGPLIPATSDTGATSTLVNVGMLVAIGCDPALTAQRVQVTTVHTLPPSASVDGPVPLQAAGALSCTERRTIS